MNSANDNHMQSSHFDITPMICDDNNQAMIVDDGLTLILDEKKLRSAENAEISKDDDAEKRPIKRLKIDISNLDENQEKSEEPSQSTTPEVVVVGLDLIRTDSSFDGYLNFDADDKTDHVIERCLNLCEQLSKIHPNAQWIFVGREYWITGAGLNHRSLSPEEKIYFESEMKKLVEKFPQLTVVAGTISTYKPIKDINKLNEIKKRYNETELCKVELGVSTKKNSQWIQYKKDIERVIQLAKKKENVYRVKNTCKIYRSDKVMQHNKTMPFKETNSNLFSNNSIYVPPKPQYQSTLFQINSGQAVPIEFVVEICRENYINVAKSELKKLGRLDAKDKTQLPLFHFLISDTITVNTRKFAGQYLVHLDSQLRMTVIRDESKPDSNVNIHFYRNNLLSFQEKLQKIYCDYTKKQEQELELYDSKIYTSDRDIATTSKYELARNSFLKKFNKRPAQPVKDTSESKIITHVGSKRKR